MSKQGLLLPLIALFAFATLPQDPKDLATRVSELEKRVEALERVGVAPPAAPPQWTVEQIRRLWVAATALQREKASPVRLRDRGLSTEDLTDLMNAIGLSSSLAFDAEKCAVLRSRPKQASELAARSLALYNKVAQALQEPLRTIDSK